jgi:hypothetical protein
MIYASTALRNVTAMAPGAEGWRRRSACDDYYDAQQTTRIQ